MTIYTKDLCALLPHLDTQKTHIPNNFQLFLVNMITCNKSFAQFHPALWKSASVGEVSGCNGLRHVLAAETHVTTIHNSRLKIDILNQKSKVWFK